MNKPDPQRFIVSRLAQGTWLVIDQVHNARLVASCPLEGDASAIAALMNRDPVDALKQVKFSLDRLDILLADRDPQVIPPQISGEDLNSNNDK